MKRKNLLIALLVTVFALGSITLFPTVEVVAEEDLPTLIYWTIGGEPEDLAMVEDAINEYAAEEVGAKIDYYYGGWGDYGQKMSTIINSSEPYDLAFGSSIDGYSNYAQMGIFADLRPALENTPELVEFIPEDLWTAVTLSEGEIYGVPTYKDSSATQYWVWQKSVVEALDIPYEEITELEELGPELQKIVEWEDYEGEYPLYMDKDGINSLFFDYEPIAGPVNIPFGEATAVNLYEQDDVVARFEKLREYYDAGYINPDANTLTGDGVPKGAMVVSSAQGFPGAEVNWGKGRGHEVVINKRMGPMYTNQSIQGSFNVVSAGSEHLQEAVNFLQKVNLDPKLRDMVAYGVEGTHFNYIEDNVIEKTDEADKYSVPAYTQGTFFTLSAVTPQPADQWDGVRKLNEEAESSPTLGFLFNPENVENEIAALQAVVEKYNSTLNTGAHDGDKSVQDILDEMNAELESAGLQDVLEEVQTQLDEFMAGREAEE